MTIGITEYAAGFSYTETERGIVASRIYHYDPDSTVDNGVEIPVVGSKLGNFPINVSGSVAVLPNLADNLLCRSRNWKVLAGHPDKIEWTIEYSNEPTDIIVFSQSYQTSTPATAITDLPVNIQFSGEYTNINPVMDKNPTLWTWSLSGEKVHQPIPFRVNSSTIRFTRHVSDSNYSPFAESVRNLSGKLNSSGDPFGSKIGGGPRCWLFTGATAEMFRNSTDEKFWRVDLEFVYRDPDGLNYEGWDKVLRLDGVWDIPIKYGGGKLYAEGDFATLFA